MKILDDILMHFGTPRHSGRYPWGSGDDPYQHGTADFLARVDELQKRGWKPTAENIKKEFNMSTKQYREEYSNANNQRKMDIIRQAKRMKEKEGKTTTEIGKEFGVNESTVRGWFNSDHERKLNSARATADIIKAEIDKKGMVDLGPGVAEELRISQGKLNNAKRLLKEDGYPVYSGRFDQVTNPGRKTTQTIACPPGTPHKDIYNLEKVHSLTDYISSDNGETFEKAFVYPKSLDQKRVQVRYAEDGGTKKDGIIELRRNVDDISLGNSRYSQVRILVNNDHYIKGVALYSDDIPDGVDVIFNTNKSKATKKMDVFKPIEKDPDNPFGSNIKEKGGQSYYIDKNGKKQLSVINKTREEGDWSEWRDALPSQFLSKQPKSLAERQLNLALDDKRNELEDIQKINNPVVKRYYLNKFADSCDKQSVDLSAAALPGQKHHVIIPLNSLKDTEVYATRYPNGTKVALIRYPHGGTFEIPILTVNNKNKEGKRLLGTDEGDGIGITHKVAERLSGADFDGDTVMCVPTHGSNGKVKIYSTSELDGLIDFEPKTSYGPDHISKDSDGKERYFRNGIEYKPMTNKQNQMGVISNLITDMTILGATDSEKTRAVSHSMVVIDAEKHKLDYKSSEKDNNIKDIQQRYQRRVDENGKVHTKGSSTIISRASGPTSTLKRQGNAHVNIKGTKYYDPSKPEGALVYEVTDDLYYPDKKYDKKTGMVTLRTDEGTKIEYNINDRSSHAKYNPVEKINSKGEVEYTNKDGTIKYRRNIRTQQSTRMAETTDARTLISTGGTQMEELYADYANALKKMANESRVQAYKIPKVAIDKKAKEEYATEVASLKAKLSNSVLNSPKEREAQRRANVEIKTKKALYPDLKPKEVSKIATQSLNKNRINVGSVKRRDRNIAITDNEWKAIQSGAVSNSVLEKVLNNTDADKLRERATPKERRSLSASQQARIRSLQANGRTLSEIANVLGVSTSTVSKYLKGVN